jgi:hypothetical protein
MWISKIKLQNIRVFEEETLELSKYINVIVGQNNSGKSSIIKGLLSIQSTGTSISTQDLRLGKNDGLYELFVKIQTGDVLPSEIEKIVFKIMKTSQSSNVVLKNGNIQNLQSIPTIEPSNAIYPFLSKRKTTSYDETINSQTANEITGNLKYLYGRIDKLITLPVYDQYLDACDKILGFPVKTSNSSTGKKACYIIDNKQNITIDKMGEGIPNILGLIVDLCLAENKIFVIEEPENDIHPKALKGLLELIMQKSQNNQFIITTHSNIVTRYLGSLNNSKIFYVSTKLDGERIPKSTIAEVEKTPESRHALLEELGYEFNDIEIHDGWLFLEEATAEKIVRNYLINWFTPSLERKLRTFSARGKDGIEVKFDDLDRLFCFLNLQPVYKNRAWVIIDGGSNETKILQRIKQKYIANGWTEDHFLQLGQHDFENYLPKKFSDKVNEILNMPHGSEKQKAKTEILNQVETWIKENDIVAKEAFALSAAEVIEKLKIIEQHITK